MFLELGKVLRTIAYDGIAKIVISGSSIRVVREPKAKHSGRSSTDKGSSRGKAHGRPHDTWEILIEFWSGNQTRIYRHKFLTNA